MDEDKVIEIRKESISKFLKEKFDLISYIILGIILWVNIWIRTLPMKVNPSTGNPGLWDVAKNTWTLGPDLDPFLFLRYAKIIVENGSLPAVDYMRYVPVGYIPAGETRLLPYSIAYLHKFISFFYNNISVDYSGVIFPVVFCKASALCLCRRYQSIPFRSDGLYAFGHQYL